MAFNITPLQANDDLEPDTRRLSLDDFVHLKNDTRLAQTWLFGALASARSAQFGYRAGHLLVTGAPGLGKTEWVRAVVRDVMGTLAEANINPVHLQAFELAVLESDGKPISGAERLRHLRMAMAVFCGQDGNAAGETDGKSADGEGDVTHNLSPESLESLTTPPRPVF